MLVGPVPELPLSEPDEVPDPGVVEPDVPVPALPEPDVPEPAEEPGVLIPDVPPEEPVALPELVAPEL